MKAQLYSKLLALLVLTLSAIGCSGQTPVADVTPGENTPASQPTSVAATPSGPVLAQSWKLINFGAPW